MSDIFLSYASDDRSRARSLAEALEAQGWSVWWDRIIPAGRTAWPMDPTAPLGVPNIISKAFWGGLWGAALNLALGHLRGLAYWLAWIAIGAFALTLVAFFVVPHLKAQPMPVLWPPFAIGCLLNGAWGFGTALFLRAMGVGRE